MPNAAQQLVVQIVGDVADFTSKGLNTEKLLKNLEQRFGSLGEAGQIASGAIAASTGRIAVGAATAGVAVLAFAVKAEQMAARVDAAMRQVGASSPALRANLDDVRSSVEGVAIATGRSRDEIYDAAQQIARLGVASQAEFAAKLKAATLISDATGTQLQTAVDGVDQLADAFDLSADQVVAAMAKIYSAASGKVDFDSIFTALQSATPRIQELGLSFETSVKAIVALLDRGFAGKKVNEFFSSHDADAIRQIATEAHTAAGALQEFQDAADFRRGGTDREFTRVLNDFNAAMAELGAQLLPAVNTGLRATSTLIDEITHKKLGQSIGIGTASDPYEAFKRSLQTPEQTWATNHGSTGTWGSGPAAGSSGRTPLPMSGPAKKALADAAKAAAEADAEFAQLATTTSGAKSQSDQFADAIGKWATKAFAATNDLAKFDAQLNQLQVVLAKLQQNEALEKQRKAAEDAADAWRSLDDAFARASNDAVAKFDQESADLFAALGKQASKITNPDELLDYLDWVDQLKAKYADLRKNVVATDDVQKLLNDDLGRLAELKPGLDALVKAQNEQAEAKRHVLEMASAWDQVGRSIIAAAQAIGGLSDSTAAALQNVVSLGTGIVNLFGGNIATGLAETVTSLAALGRSLFSGDNAAQQAQLKVLADNSAALRHLADTLKNVNQPASSLDTAWAAVLGLTRQPSAAGAMYPFGGLGVKANTSGLTPEQLDAIDAAAKELGITLDGTEASFVALFVAMNRARPILEAQYQETQKEAQQDAEVRRLRAEGHAEEADALERQEAAERELAKAREDGASADTIAAIQAAQFAEAAKAAADALRKAAEDALAAATTKASQDLEIDDITDPTTVFGKKAAAYAGAGGALGKLFDGLDLNKLSTDDVAQLDEKFKELFHQLEDAPDSVDLAGLSIDDLKQALLELDSAADTVAASVESAADAFNDATQTLSIHERIFGTDPVQHAQDVAAAANIDLSGYKLSTKAGHDAALSYLESLYTANPAMGPILAAIADAINAIPITDGTGGGGGAAPTPGSGGGSIADQVRSITIEQADRLVGLVGAELAVSRQQTTLLTSIRDLLAAAATTVVTAPSIPFGGLAGVGGSVTITMNISQTFNGPVGSETRAAARGLSREILDFIDTEFSRRYKAASTLLGNVTQR